jgi:hypothetical protein
MTDPEMKLLRLFRRLPVWMQDLLITFAEILHERKDGE